MTLEQPDNLDGKKDTKSTINYRKKMAKKITCKTGLKKNIISKAVFDRETELCKMLSKDNKGKCGWGRCKDCGIIPFLVKLYQGILLEKDDEIKAARNKYLN